VSDIAFLQHELCRRCLNYPYATFCNVSLDYASAPYSPDETPFCIHFLSDIFIPLHDNVHGVSLRSFCFHLPKVICRTSSNSQCSTNRFSTHTKRNVSTPERVSLPWPQRNKRRAQKLIQHVLQQFATETGSHMFNQTSNLSFWKAR